MKNELYELIQYERRKYMEYAFLTKLSYWASVFRRDVPQRILKYQILSRKADYYFTKKIDGDIRSSILYLIYTRRKNILGEKLGLEVSTRNIKRGLFIYHFNVIVNQSAHIGENCHFHGDNCVGNNGTSGSKSPRLGDNVVLGVGAKVIGDVYIANNIKIAAGSVVVKSFYEEGAIIGGIPGVKIKN